MDFPSIDRLLTGLPQEIRESYGRPALTRTPVPVETVAALYPDLPAARRVFVARALEEREALGTVIQDLTDRFGQDYFPPFIRCEGAEQLLARQADGRPAILVGWHMGNIPLIGCGLNSLGISLLTVHRKRESDPVSPASFAEGDLQGGAMALKKCVEQLRAGRMARLALDGFGGDPLRVPCLGRELRISRGALALARICGVPIIPTAIRWDWETGMAVVHIGEPLASPRTVGNAQAAEQALGVAATRWLDAYLRTYPDQLGARGVERLRSAPTLEDLRTRRRAKTRDYSVTRVMLRKLFTARYPDGQVLIVNKGDPKVLAYVERRRAAHFPQDARGAYPGFYPTSSTEAIAHLEALRDHGAAFLAFPRSSLWWLAHYGAFREHLDRRYPRIWSDLNGVAYSLKGTHSAGASGS